MAQVGKLCDESVDALIRELDNVSEAAGAEGDAVRYFDHVRQYSS